MDTKTLTNRRTRRTTLTLEADVAEYIEERLAKNRKLKEKSLINGLLRKGIRVEAETPLAKFEIKPFKTRLRPGITPEMLEEMIDEI
jgi:hypothetical protein